MVAKAQTAVVVKMQAVVVAEVRATVAEARAIEMAETQTVVAASGVQTAVPTEVQNRQERQMGQLQHICILALEQL